jgi:flagellar hook-associated protein FlgK
MKKESTSPRSVNRLIQQIKDLGKLIVTSQKAMVVNSPRR